MDAAFDKAAVARSEDSIAAYSLYGCRGTWKSSAGNKAGRVASGPIASPWQDGPSSRSESEAPSSDGASEEDAPPPPLPPFKPDTRFMLFVLP